MRIISGTLKGKRLFSIPGRDVRPTADKVREAIFSICASKIGEARVLDLFAGTGAFGLEALSRGAAAASFIDRADKSLRVIRKNIAACKMEDRTRVLKWDIEKDLNCIKDARPPFDLVFLDPPYRRNLIVPVLRHLAASPALAPGATVIIEHAADDPLPEQNGPFRRQDVRKYGKTLVSFFAFMIG